MQNYMKTFRENPHSNPYWQIVAKLIQIFFQNFSFPGDELDRFTGKLVQQNFMSSFSVFVKYRVMTEIDTHKILMNEFTVIRSNSFPGNLPIRAILGSTW